MVKVKSDPAADHPVPTVITDLVERFARNRDAYKAGKYNETQVRREFIDPLFKALGWDIDNEQGYAEAYKDVIHEDAIRIGGAVKAPDYCFRIGGTRKFFLEAKKPSVDIKGDATPAFQLRRYAWSGKLPLSVLTDFEEFAIYDCRVKPVKTDKSSTARIGYYTFDQYTEPKVWSEIASIFSREAILKGSFDKYAQSSKRKRGTAEVDDAFLAEIETWRSELARNIALRNSTITPRELNTAVQLTVDRIIFLRICEDRGIEDYGRLQALLNGERVYQRLFELLEKADQRYNSGLFYFKAEKGRGPADALTPSLTIDDKVLKGLIKGLYYPDSPYEFSVLPADILGHVYEQFLGKVIRLTKGHRAEIEEKPEVRKAGGVYYTPTYIVQYIVEHTVGKLLEGQSVKWVGTEKGKAVDQPRLSRTLRVLDPACGSGSFLIGAYQHLLDWHLNWYMNDEPEKWARRKRPPIAANQKGEYRLTTPERKRILLEHIYGVDIDSQAVEVTKLSLLLKVLEGETAHSLGTHLWYEKERALPDLSANIKCGNSLIGPDFYEHEQQIMFDDEERYRINAFDWKAEFAEVFAVRSETSRAGEEAVGIGSTSRAREEAVSLGDANAPLVHTRGSSGEGGFDAVIGNPPYGATFHEDESPYLAVQFLHFARITDSYIAFMEQAHALLRVRGRFGYIVPSAWLGGPRYRPIREYLLSHTIDSVVLLPFDVFKDAYIDTVLITTAKGPPSPRHVILAHEFPKREKILHIHLHALACSEIPQEKWAEGEDKKFVLHSGMTDLLSAIRSRTLTTIGDIAEMKRGVLFDLGLLTDGETSEKSHPYFEGDVYRYSVNWAAERCIEYGPKMREYPKEFRWFEGSRIVLRRLVNRQQRLMASILTETVITNKNLYAVLPRQGGSLQYLLGVLNSQLISRLYLSQVSQATKDDFPQVTIRDTLSLPSPTLDLANPNQCKIHDHLVSLVQRMLDLHKNLAGAKTAHEREVIQRDIDATDKQIDRLVYDLYGLTEEEIAIVEEGTK